MYIIKTIDYMQDKLVVALNYLQKHKVKRMERNYRIAKKWQLEEVKALAKAKELEESIQNDLEKTRVIIELEQNVVYKK